MNHHPGVSLHQRIQNGLAAGLLLGILLVATIVQPAFAQQDWTTQTPSPSPTSIQEPPYCTSRIYNPDGILEDTSEMDALITKIRDAKAEPFVGAMTTTGDTDIADELHALLASCSALSNTNGSIKSNAVAILVATEDRKTRIQAGAKMMAFLPGKSTGSDRLESTVNQEFKDGSFEGGLTTGLDFILEHLENGQAIVSTQAEIDAEQQEDSLLGVSGLAVILFVAWKILGMFRTNRAKRREEEAKRQAFVGDLESKIDGGNRQISNLLADYTALEQDTSLLAGMTDKEESDEIRNDIVQLNSALQAQQQRWGTYADTLQTITGEHDLDDLTGLSITVERALRTNINLDTTFTTLSQTIGDMRANVDNMQTMTSNYEIQLATTNDLLAQVATHWTVEPAATLLAQASEHGAQAAEHLQTNHLIGSYKCYTQAMACSTAAYEWLTTVDQTFVELTSNQEKLQRNYSACQSQYQQARATLHTLQSDYAKETWEELEPGLDKAEGLLGAVQPLVDELAVCLDRTNVQWTRANACIQSANKQLREATLQADSVINVYEYVQALANDLPDLFAKAHHRAKQVLEFMANETLDINDELETKAQVTAATIAEIEKLAKAKKPDLFVVEQTLHLIMTELDEYAAQAEGQVTESTESRVANANAWEDTNEDIKEFKAFLEDYEDEVSGKIIKQFKQLRKDFDTISRSAITETEGVVNVVGQYQQITAELRALALKIHDDHGYSRAYEDDDETLALSVGYILGSVRNDEPYYRDFSSYQSDSSGGGGSSFGGGGGSSSGGGSTSSW